MKSMVLQLVFFCAYFAANVLAQNAVISSFLRECYSEPNLVNRNYLPPMTLPVFLDILRKIEDHPNSIGDLRQMSTGIVQLFRQDGIIYDPTVVKIENIVPFSPTGFSAYKNRLLLTKLIPDNQYKLPNEVVGSEEKCALHHMLSSSIYSHARGDEEWTCNYLTGLSAQSAKLKAFDKTQDVEVFDTNGAKDLNGRQIMGVSNCPIETGVVLTSWGEVAMGTVIAGIASGMEEQNVLVSDLVGVRKDYTDNTLVVNNRYASTLAGDIAETAIRQGTSGSQITVGASGGWNTTQARRFYFLQRNSNLELTDAEIRGGIDGLAVSELGQAYAKDFPELKLSQLIDMYYSENGIMHEARFRACNRKALVPDMADKQNLMDRSLGPAVALYHMSVLSASAHLRGIQHFINKTVDAFHAYLPNNLNDTACNATKDQVLRPRIDLYLIMDPSLSRSLQSAYLVNQIEVGKFGSSVTLISNSGDVLVEKTSSMATFYQRLAKSIVASPAPLNMVSVMKKLIELATAAAGEEVAAHYSGGMSSIALFLSDIIPLAGNERVKAVQQSQILRNIAPDLRLVFATSSASETAVAPMLQSYSDFIPIVWNSGGRPEDFLRGVADYLRIAPRRIVNPLCGVQWQNENSGTVGYTDYVDADGINVYRIIPNYYYDVNLYRVIRIESTDLGSISVCYSWSDTFPRRNRTSTTVPPGVMCGSANTGGFVEIPLSTACEFSDSIRNCPSLYITVSSAAVTSTGQCKDADCRYPNDVKYLVVARDLGCFSDSNSLQIQRIYLIFSLFVNLFLYSYL